MFLKLKVPNVIRQAPNAISIKLKILINEKMNELVTSTSSKTTRNKHNNKLPKDGKL